MNRAEDPGWRPALRGAGMLLVPMAGAFAARRATDTLILLRQAWVAFVTALGVIAVVVLVLYAVIPGGGIDGRATGAIVVGIGVIAQVIASSFLPAVDGTSEGTVRHTFARAFFVRVALAQVAALVGFFGFFLTANPAVYLAGAVVAFAGMLDAAPTSRRIERVERDLEASGSDVDVLAALVSGGLDSP